MPEVELSAGTLEYEDTGGGPAVVLLHGLLQDASLWDGVVVDLAGDHRCVAPTLPLGAHRQPMGDDADLSLPGIARLVKWEDGFTLVSPTGQPGLPRSSRGSCVSRMQPPNPSTR